MEAKGIGNFIGKRYCRVFDYADHFVPVSPTIRRSETNY